MTRRARNTGVGPASGVSARQNTQSTRRRTEPAPPEYRTWPSTRIRWSLTTKGWSQQELGDQAGIDRSYMSGIERGVRNISVLKVFSIARALGVQPASLFAKN